MDELDNKIIYKKQQIEILERRSRIIAGLPHRHRWKFYKWSRLFYESRNKINLLTAANQIGKSTTAIRKCIEWAGNTKLWPELWPNSVPRQFWYLYPTKDVATIEFNTKWVPELMPCGDYKTHKTFGWKAEYTTARTIHHIEFNSGVYVFFKSYRQDIQALQTGSCHVLFTDEELPEELYPELIMRLSAGSIDGYYNMVFTATLGQEFWRRAMEETSDKEVLKGAFKQQISMYDCIWYEDGTPGPYTSNYIDRLKLACKSEAEVQRRIYGKFVLDSGRIYEAFDPAKNVIAPLWQKPPKDWLVYTGVDIGSGGDKGHPAAIVFVAVRPDFQYGVVFRGWRSPPGLSVTSSDILLKYRMLKADLTPVLQSYDWAAKDFFNYAARVGENFVPAEKGHSIGEDTLNVLFKNGMLDIFDIEELVPLVTEIKGLLRGKSKTGTHDDFVDALRYSITGRVNWDFCVIGKKEVRQTKKELTELDKRRMFMLEGDKEYREDILNEINEWNELAEY